MVAQPTYRAFFGTETEYAVSAIDSDGRVVMPDAVAVLLARSAATRPHLKGRESGIWLTNASRMYVDAGGHPEVATAEALDPWQGTIHALAGDRLMSELAGEVAEKTGMHVLVRKGNVDYSAPGISWASHENYLVTKSPSELRPWLTPHLVSRIIYTGAGGLDPFDTGRARFVLSPRALFSLRRGLRDPSPAWRRELVDEREEPHCSGGYRRQHLSCGDSLRGHLASFLRLSTTALVIGLIETERVGAHDVRLAAPPDAVRTVARDWSLRRPLALANGRSATALEIQRCYLQTVRENLDVLPEWASSVCEVWQDTLDRLACGPDAVADRLDWAIKLAIYRDRAERRGRWWPDRRPAPSVLIRVAAAPEAAAWRQELAEIDTRFGMLHPPGLFDELDAARVLRHRVPGVEAIERALTEPPSQGRAVVRGRVIARLARRPKGWACAWNGINHVVTLKRLDLSDPFADSGSERWTRPLSGRGGPAARTLLQLLDGRAGRASSLRHSIRACAERICAPGARAIRRLMGPYGASLNSSAVARRGEGRLEEAEWLLRTALAVEVEAHTASHPIVAHRRCNLATVLMLQNRMDEAVEEVDRAWSLVGSAYDWTSARFLTVRLALAMLRGEALDQFVGQLKSHLAIRPLPRAPFETPHTGTGDVFRTLSAQFRQPDVALLTHVIDVLNGVSTVESLDEHPGWREAEATPLDLPWPDRRPARAGDATADDARGRSPAAAGRA